jgi:hypothetical protein
MLPIDDPRDQPIEDESSVVVVGREHDRDQHATSFWLCARVNMQPFARGIATL